MQQNRPGSTIVEALEFSYQPGSPIDVFTMTGEHYLLRSAVFGNIECGK
jgi:hypothetical protein